MSEENKEKQKSLPVTDFYDLVIKIDSFRNLKKKEQGDYGWDILYSKDFDYDKRTKEERVKIEFKDALHSDCGRHLYGVHRM